MSVLDFLWYHAKRFVSPLKMTSLSHMEQISRQAIEDVNYQTIGKLSQNVNSSISLVVRVNGDYIEQYIISIISLN